MAILSYRCHHQPLPVNSSSAVSRPAFRRESTASPARRSSTVRELHVELRCAALGPPLARPSLVPAPPYGVSVVHDESLEALAPRARRVDSAQPSRGPVSGRPRGPQRLLRPSARLGVSLALGGKRGIRSRTFVSRAARSSLRVVAIAARASLELPHWQRPVRLRIPSKPRPSSVEPPQHRAASASASLQACAACSP